MQELAVGRGELPCAVCVRVSHGDVASGALVLMSVKEGAWRQAMVVVVVGSVNVAGVCRETWQTGGFLMLSVLNESVVVVLSCVAVAALVVTSCFGQ